MGVCGVFLVPHAVLSPFLLARPRVAQVATREAWLEDTPLVHHVKDVGVVCCCGLAGWGGSEVRKEGNQRHNRLEKSEGARPPQSNAFAPACPCLSVPLCITSLHKHTLLCRHARQAPYQETQQKWAAANKGRGRMKGEGGEVGVGGLPGQGARRCCSCWCWSWR